ncbi:MAG: TetR/AcrR family transcriptional regulator [Candidatus Eisenbacteria bacterium]
MPKASGSQRHARVAGVPASSSRPRIPTPAGSGAGSGRAAAVPPPTRGQRRSRNTRQQLLSAAREVFAERGMDLTSIDDITRRADVGKGTFYYHFKNKERLIRELVRSVLGGLIATIDQRCAGCTDLDSLLDTIIQAHIEFFSNRWADFVLYFQGRADLTLEQGYSGIETPFMEYLERIETLIDGVVRYHLPKPLLRRIACAVVGFLSGYYSFAAIASQGEDVDDAFRALRGAMVASLARFIREAVPAETRQEG